MNLAMIGLGRMGANMTRRLSRGGHRVVGYNQTPAITGQLQAEAGMDAAYSLEEAVEKLAPPRAVWMMLPSGDPTEETVQRLSGLLAPGDTAIDGGNSNYKDSQRRAAMLQEKGLHFVDVGTSGGIWGLTVGFSLMVGGNKEAAERLRPIFETLAPAPDKGWGYVGPSGAGHYVKMVHNGIEYGMMQAYAEGFEILKSKKELGLDVHQISKIWQHGSVVRSWLLELASDALAEDAELSGVKPWVSDSGEGRWTVADAIDLDVPAPVITLSLLMRLVSRQEDSYAFKLLAALRNKFGGHAIKLGT